jgi:hypothetical protein
LQNGGPITVITQPEIHLGYLVPGLDDSTPLAERFHAQADGTFWVLDGIRICQEGVWIDLAMAFSNLITSEKETNDIPDLFIEVYLSLDATVALLNERLVFS